MEFCQNCKQHIPTSNFLIHSLRCEKNTQFCTICNIGVPLVELDAHQNLHATFTCSCKKIVTKINEEIHNQHECGNRMVPCAYCAGQVTADDLPLHEIQCKTKTFTCGLCEMPVLVHEKNSHTRECIANTIKCLYCDTLLPVPKMADHEYLCGSRTEECFTCHKWVQKRHLRSHATSHEPQENNFAPDCLECYACGKTYTAIEDLLAHQEALHRTKSTDATHTGAFDCSFCAKSFTVFDELIEHMQLHE